MMEKRFEAMGNKMTTTLGFENRMVVLYWIAFENKSWKICEKIFRRFEKRG